MSFHVNARRVVTGAVASAAVAIFGFAGATGAAIADPANGDGDGKFTAAGSDTIQDVYNAFASDAAYNIASFDAFPAPDEITIKGKLLERPHGSGDGVEALSASWNPDSDVYTSSLSSPSNKVWHLNQGAYQSTDPTAIADATINIARSSSSPSSFEVDTITEADLVYVPLGRDAVSVAIFGTSIDNFSSETLAALYSNGDYDADGDDSTNEDGDVQNDGANVEVYSDGGWVTVHPKVPQSASGTRGFFYGAIGVDNPEDDEPSSFPAWVTPGYDENDGSVLSATGDLIPFSAAQWIAQKNTSTTDVPNTIPAGTTLTSINGDQAAFIEEGSWYPSDELYGSADSLPVGFARDVYSVVPKQFVATQQDSSSWVADGDATDLGELVTDTLPGNSAVLTDYGFLQLGYYADAEEWKYSEFTNPTA